MPEYATLSTMADGLIRWFAETTLVASALAMAAALLARSGRLTPGPAARHAVWLIVLLKLVIPPLIHWPWSIPSFGVGGQGHPSVVEARPSGEAPALLAVGPADTLPISAVALAPLGPDSSVEEVLVDVAAPIVEEHGIVAPEPFTSSVAWTWPDPALWLASTWLVGSVVLGTAQARRIGRFGRTLRDSIPAPDWLVEEAARVGDRLGVRVPPIRVVPRLSSPLVWCLGSPVLLIPAGLLKSLDAGSWRAILAHELAHLRRGDHWVRRLELIAGLAWWWNPLYWLTRRRVDHEAELACDAWALWASPEDRLTYAESLIRIGTSLCPARSPSPALGVVGNGRSFERRLTMILLDRVDRRIPALSLASSFFLAVLALPSWTVAGPSQDPVDAPVVEEAEVEVAVAPIAPVPPVPPVPPVAPVPPVPPVPPAPPAALFYAASTISVDDDDDDDDDEEKLEAKKKAEAKEKATKAKAKTKARTKGGSSEEMEKKMEAVGKEMEQKFGPGSDFAKQMEKMGKDMEKQFGEGSEFAKQMEKKFGPDSDFAKQMEKQFGPGSEFAKQMEKMGKDMEKQFGEGSEFAKQMQEMGKAQGEGSKKLQGEARKIKEKAEAEARVARDQARAEANKAQLEARKARGKVEVEVRRAREDARKARADSKKEGARGKEGASGESRSRRIDQILFQIEQLKAELDRLKDQPDDKDQDDKDLEESDERPDARR